MGRTPFDLADIVRQHRGALEAIQPLTSAQGRALSAIALCRTAALGGHRNVCLACGKEEDPSYTIGRRPIGPNRRSRLRGRRPEGVARASSCRNRHCPKCQALAQERWIASRAEALLPVPHFHGVFTLPEDLRPLARRHPVPVYDALFRAASAALLEMGQTRLKTTLGLTLVLHTWTRDLRYHPHVHALISAGGLALDGESFLRAKEKFLLHVKPLAALFKGKMMAALRTLQAKGLLALGAGAFGALMASLAAQDWHVYLKRPFSSPAQVLRYLGCYTHRVGISNSRLVEVTGERVTFRTKDGRTVGLPPVDFLRRFIQHILPDRFKKIRHFGLYAAPKALARAKAHCGPLPVPEASKLTWQEHLLALTGRDVTRCAECGGTLGRRLLPPPRTFHRHALRALPRSPP